MLRARSRTAAPLPLDQRQVRATLLPPRAFVDPDVFEWELEEIFSGWVCVGHASLVAEPGSYLMREIGTDSVVVMGGNHGVPSAFLNVCRHRGSRLIQDSEGGVRRRL